MRWVLGTIVYSYSAVLGIISISGAIYKPALGAIACMGLAAFFFDKNKEVFRKFFVSPQIFFRKNMLVTGYHRAYFFSFLIALIANLTMAVMRWV